MGTRFNQSPYSLGDRIEELFLHRASDTPTRVAVEQGSDTLTYRELAELSARVAARLRRMGVGPGAYVPTLIARSPELVVALLGILRTGAAYVAMDAAWPQERLRDIRQRTGAHVVITDLRQVSDDEANVAIEDLSQDGYEPAQEYPGRGGDPASVFFTSGSTGRPKGAVSPHHATIRTVVNCPGIPLTPETVFLQAASLPWDMFNVELWGALLNGGRAVLLDRSAHAVDSAGLERAIAAGVNTVWLTSSLFNVLADEAPAVFEELRVLLVGGEPVSVPHLRRVLERQPALHVVNGYGPVETIFATRHVIRPCDVAAPASAVPIGTALPRTEIAVLDAEGRPVEPGVMGEIMVGGDGVALGYLGDDEETARRFFDGSEWGLRGRCYRTGDLGVVDSEGLLWYRGRADAQIKIQGVRIEPGEVEAILRSHPMIASCCVVRIEPAPGRPQIACAYTTADGVPLGADELGRFASERMLVAMRPTVTRHLADLPLGPTGKVDRAAVRDALTEQAAAAFSAPAEGDDSLISQARHLLGRATLTEDDDLISAGASSLDAIRLAARVGKRVGAKVTMRDVYERRTLRRLMAIDASRAPEELAIASGSRGEKPAELPLSYAQRRFFFAELVSPGSPGNTITLSYLIDGPMDVERLELALRDVLDRHPALRTTYRWTGDEPTQQVLPVNDVDRLVDVCEPPADDAEPPDLWVSRLATEWSEATPLRLDAGPPFRARLCRLEDGRNLLLVQVHHIAFDGWSESLLLEELAAAYRCPGTSAPAERATYSDYVSWERALQRQCREEDMAFWRDVLRDSPPAFLPAPSGAHEARSNSARTSVPAAIVGRAVRAAARSSAFAGATLLAAAAETFAREFDVSDMCVGTVSPGRFDEQFESVIGCFVNPLAIRLTGVREQSSRQLLSCTSRRLQDALAHARTPFDEVVRELAPPRERNPFFQPLVVLQAPPPAGNLRPWTSVEALRMHPSRMSMELLIEALPIAAGAWDLGVHWRADGIDDAAGEAILEGVTDALKRFAALA